MMGALDVAWNKLFLHSDQFGVRWTQCLNAVHQEVWKISDDLSIPKFNDSKHTTKEDVLLVFKKAIASAREQQ
jgi:hypothetical protein